MLKQLLILLFLVSVLAGCGRISSTGTGVALPASPQNVALLVPLSGALAPYGNAIRNGFFTAYYTQKELSGYSPVITVYDSNNQSISALYQQAVQAGNNVVVGPLNKTDVKTLIQSDSLTVPVLALNAIDNDENPNVYEFALSPADEATQAAIKISADHHNKVIIFAPNTSAGKRLVTAFTTQWEKTGGAIIKTEYYDSHTLLSESVGNALGVTQSNEEKRSLDKLFQRKMRYIPNRRQDFDSVFMIASPSVARQIVPLLRYYFVTNIPIYATSLINDKKPDADLEGVEFCDLPWILAPTQMPPVFAQMQQRIQTLWPEDYARYASFFAMGIDAYDLIPTLNHLRSGGVILGATGVVSLHGQYIYRQLWWAKIVNRGSAGFGYQL